MKKRVLEMGKTGLIVLLVTCLLLLTVAAMPVETIRSSPWLSSVLQPFAAVLGLPEAELVYVEQAQPIADAAQPLTISVCNAGGRYTAQWDFAALDTAYETLGGLLGEALDTAQSFAPSNLVQLKRALSQNSVCFDYDFSLPMELLSSWLDAGEPEESGQAFMYVLAEEGGTVRLYLVGEDCYRADTQVDPENFRALLEQFKSDGSQFAFETDSKLEPMFLRPQTAPKIESVYVSSPCDSRYVESLATALGFNAYDENRYTNSAGVTYYSEPNCSLQIGADGRILLKSSAPERFRAASMTLQAQVELARSLVELAVKEVMGSARIYLSGISREEGQTVCSFDYVLAGIPVSCGGEPAVRVTFSEQSVVQMNVFVANFALTGGRLSVLPPVQAEAILPEGSRLALEYDCSNPGELTAGWKLPQNARGLWR